MLAHLTLNPSDRSEEACAHLPSHLSSRGVVFDDGGNIGTLYEGDMFFSFPGGTIEEGESTLDAFVREVREELGAHLSHIEHIAQVTEYLFDMGVANRTAVFSAHIVADRQEPIFFGDEDEHERACAVRWVVPAELERELRARLEHAAPTHRFRVERDLFILERCME